MNEDILFELNNVAETLEVCISRLDDLIKSVGAKNDRIYTKALTDDTSRINFSYRYDELRILADQSETLLIAYVSELKQQHQQLIRTLQDIKITAS